MFGLKGYYWNPVVGCDEVSIACKNCYVKSLTERQQKTGIGYYEKGFEVNLLSDKLDIPIKRHRSALYQVCSMSDLFNPKVSDDFIDRVFNVMTTCQQHLFIISTKYSCRMAAYLRNKTVSDNIIIGVSIENADVGAGRLNDLYQINCPTKFVLFEPLLGDVSGLDITWVDWVLVGGQYGKKSIPMQKKWVFNILRICQENYIPFYFKQWGAYGEDGIRRSKKENGDLVNGHCYHETPQLKKSQEIVIKNIA